MSKLFAIVALLIGISIAQVASAARGWPTIKKENQSWVKSNPTEFLATYNSGKAEAIMNVSKAKNDAAIAELFRRHGFGSAMEGLTNSEIAAFVYSNSVQVPFNEISFGQKRFKNTYVVNGELIFASWLEESKDYLTTRYRKFIGPDKDQDLIWAKVGCENLLDDLADKFTPTVDAEPEVADDGYYYQEDGQSLRYANPSTINIINYVEGSSAIAGATASSPEGNDQALLYPTPVQQQVVYPQSTTVVCDNTARWNCSYPSYSGWYPNNSGWCGYGGFGIGATLGFGWNNWGNGGSSSSQNVNYNFNYNNNNNYGSAGTTTPRPIYNHALPTITPIGGPGPDPTGDTDATGGNGGGPGPDPTGGPGPDPTGGGFGRIPSRGNNGHNLTPSVSTTMAPRNVLPQQSGQGKQFQSVGPRQNVSVSQPSFPSRSVSPAQGFGGRGVVHSAPAPRVNTAMPSRGGFGGNFPSKGR